MMGRSFACWPATGWRIRKPLPEASKFRGRSRQAWRRFAERSA